jgi:signal transduction histidine kinase
MRLADFIESSLEPILVEWEAFARGTTPGAKMDALALRDNAGAILLATIHDMRGTQSRSERSAKSKGQLATGSERPTLNGASDQHAIGRLGSGFDLLEVISEYRALRASVLQLWHDSGPHGHDSDIDDVTRFNESIDQSLAKAVSSYTRSVNQSRDMFMAILSHDLRNPLNAITMSAQLLPHLSEPSADMTNVVTQIATSSGVMARMISDLLDYTRTRLGAGMPVLPVPIDLDEICAALVKEFRSGHPDREICYVADGDLRGDWDPDRLRQAISNLLGNAIQHGADAPVNVAARADDSNGTDMVTVAVHNGGTPIPMGELPRIFDPLVRGTSAEHPRRHRPGSIGLGLYIAREIAESHGGSISVTSTADAGTRFTLRLPRHHLKHAGVPILDEPHIQTM